MACLQVTSSLGYEHILESLQRTGPPKADRTAEQTALESENPGFNPHPIPFHLHTWSDSPIPAQLSRVKGDNGYKLPDKVPGSASAKSI